MKKTTAVILFLSIGGVIVFGWVIGRLTGAVNFYTFATESNMPTHTVGEIFFTSNLKMPDYNCFVCFNNANTRKETYIYRLIGKPDDVIEIKNTFVYRNGQKLNEPYTWNEYILSRKQFNSIAGYIQTNNNSYNEVGDSVYVTLTDTELKKYGFNIGRYVAPKTDDAEMLVEFKNKGYTADNFGPIKVPADSYFLLGDNRHFALDSRYHGFVKSNEIMGTRLGK